MYITRLKMRMPQSLRFFRPRWMQLSRAHLGHTLHCNTKRPSWCFGCFRCLCKQPSENDVSHGLGCTREQRMQRIPDYKTQLGKKCAFWGQGATKTRKQDYTSILPIPKSSMIETSAHLPVYLAAAAAATAAMAQKAPFAVDRNVSSFLAFLILFLSTSAFQISFQFHIHIPQRRQ